MWADKPFAKVLAPGGAHLIGKTILCMAEASLAPRNLRGAFFIALQFGLQVPLCNTVLLVEIFDEFQLIVSLLLFLDNRIA